jgi:hypothetical protein
MLPALVGNRQGDSVRDVADRGDLAQDVIEVLVANPRHVHGESDRTEQPAIFERVWYRRWTIT